LVRHSFNIFVRAFFKKWLELEKRIGDDEGVALVKAKAVEWTQRAS
jgi:rRNA biogenesis protein RRP5